jgi:hypothetical protein
MYRILFSILILTFSCDKDPTASTDCAGIVNGVAAEDDCGVCAGGTTGVLANADKDCAGVCGGETSESDCQACTDQGFTYDCEGTCNGTVVEDCAGVCGGSAVLSGCDNACNSTAVEDCGGVCGGNAACPVSGTYILSTYISYNTSDCSGEGYDNLSSSVDFSVTLILNSNGTVIGNVVSSIEGNQTVTGSWSQNGNQVTLTLDNVSQIFTLSGSTLTGQITYPDDEYCELQIFTKE